MDALTRLSPEPAPTRTRLRRADAIASMSEFPRHRSRGDENSAVILTQGVLMCDLAEVMVPDREHPGFMRVPEGA